MQESIVVPASSGLGTTDSITLIASSSVNPGISNSSVQTFEVISGDTSPPILAASATPAALWPPNGKLVAVTIDGTVSDTGSGVDLSSGSFAVQDEYGEVQPAGTFQIGSDGSYSFPVELQASRLGSDLDGRQYQISLQAKDKAGNVGTTSITLVVPHDQR
jgi:hypothetical protein